MTTSQKLPTASYLSAWPVDGRSLLAEQGTFWSLLGQDNHQVEAILELLSWSEFENYLRQKQIRGRMYLTQGGDLHYRRALSAEINITPIRGGNAIKLPTGVVRVQSFDIGDRHFEIGRDFFIRDGSAVIHEPNLHVPGRLTFRDVTLFDGAFSRLWGEVLNFFSEDQQMGKLVRHYLAAIQNQASIHSFREFASVLFEVPVVSQDDVVVDGRDVLDGTLMIGETTAYKGPPGSKLLVQVGDKVRAGDDVFDSLQFWDASSEPPPAWLPSLKIPARYFSPYVSGDLEFLNSDQPVTNTDGAVTFPINGSDTAVDEFFAYVRQREVELGFTLGSFLADRSAPVASQIPAQINPLETVWKLWLQFGFSVSYVRLEPTVDLMNKLSLLRRLVPPWLSHLVMFSTPVPDELICIVPD